MIIYVDIDETICKTPDNRDYNKSTPIYQRIKHINSLYEKGYTIIYWTARGTVTQINWLPFIEEQLGRWGCRYHDVRVGKPQYDLWIDDKSKRIEEI